MANNYQTTCFTLRSKDGSVPVIGALGNTLIRSGIAGETPWFDEKTGEGVYEACSSVDNLLMALLDDFGIDYAQLDENPYETFTDVLKAIKERHPERVTADMMACVETWDALSGYDLLPLEDLIPLAALEPGADIGSAFFESAYTCSKNLHGEFGGGGHFWSPEVRLSVSTSEVSHAGQHLAKSAREGNAKAAADALIGDLKRVVDCLPEAFRQQVKTELAKAMAKEAGIKPRLIVELHAGVVHQVHHNIEGLEHSVMDTDVEGVDNPEAVEARNEELEKEADQLPFTD